jgi:hypothetical protein
MLWYKSWLETRIKTLMMVAFAVFPIILAALTPHIAKPASPPSVAEAESAVGFYAMYYLLVPVALAGSGIKTQSAQMKKGLHGSMYFTLSLPVSRVRLFATRAGLGMLEAVGILAIAPCAVWIMFVEPADHVSHSDLFAFWLTLSVCASGFYFLGVLLSTYLDDLLQSWISMFVVVFLRWLLSAVPLPAPVNIFRAVVSPLFKHSFPWASMGISLCAAAILCLASLRVVQTREYQ